MYLSGKILMTYMITCKRGLIFMNIGNIYNNQQENENPLEKYGRDLVEMAREGKLDPVIGRDGEIRHTIQILSRRTKKNRY